MPEQPRLHESEARRALTFLLVVGCLSVLICLSGLLPTSRGQEAASPPRVSTGSELPVDSWKPRSSSSTNPASADTLAPAPATTAAPAIEQAPWRPRTVTPPAHTPAAAKDMRAFPVTSSPAEPTGVVPVSGEAVLIHLPPRRAVGFDPRATRPAQADGPTLLPAPSLVDPLKDRKKPDAEKSGSPKLPPPFVVPPTTPVRPVVPPTAPPKPGDKKEAASPTDEDRAVLVGAARTAVALRNWDQAISRFEEYIRRFPNDKDILDIRKEYAGVLIEAGRLQQAFQEYSTLISQHPRDRDLRLSFGDLASRLRDFRLAITQFQLALELKPDDPNAAVRLARALVYADNHAAAVAIFDRYLAKLKPGDTGVPQLLPGLLVDLGWPKEAHAFLVKRLEDKPNDEEDRMTLVLALAALGDRPHAIENLRLLGEKANADSVAPMLRLAGSLLGTNDLDLAAIAYGQVQIIEPGNTLAQVGLARCFLRKFEPWEARKLLCAIVPTPVVERSVWLARAEYHRLVGEYVDARATLVHFLRRCETDHEARLALGSLYEVMGEAEKSKAEYAKIPPGVPETRRARMGIASTLLGQRRFSEAIDQCKCLLTENPADGEVIALKARILIKAGQTREAVVLCRGFLAVHLRVEMAARPVRLALARALVESGQYMEAVQDYEAILACVWGQLPEVYWNMARALEKAGNQDKAKVTRVVALNTPIGGETRNRMLLADLATGDFDDDAVLHLVLPVVKAEPENLPAFIHLADVQIRIASPTGLSEEAVKNARIILTMSPNNYRGQLALARALVVAHDYKGGVSVYSQMIKVERDLQVPHREMARTLYADNQWGSGAAAYASMLHPSADERLEEDLTSLAQRDPHVGALVGPHLHAGLHGKALEAETARVLADGGDAELQGFLRRVFLDFQAAYRRASRRPHGGRDQG